MAVPTSYTDDELMRFMHQEIGVVARTLNWSVAGDSYVETLNEVLIALGISALSDFTGRVPVLRAVARREVWESVVKACTGFYTFSADFQMFNLDQLFKHAQAALALANQECAALGVASSLGPQVKTLSFPYTNDPYHVTTDNSAEI